MEMETDDDRDNVLLADTCMVHDFRLTDNDPVDVPEIDLEALASSFDGLLENVIDFVALISFVSDFLDMLIVTDDESLMSRVDDRDGENLLRDRDSVHDRLTVEEDERDDDGVLDVLAELLLERDTDSSGDMVTDADGLLLPLRDCESSSDGERGVTVKVRVWDESRDLV